MLFLATATLYQFVWLYRTAEDLRKSRDPSITPWHWVAAPLLGPLMAVPAHYLAGYLKSWQVEEDREVGHLAEPVLVAMMIIVAYLPLFMLVVDTAVISTTVVVITLLLCLPYLTLQGQLNLNKDKGKDQYLDKPRSFARHQMIGMVVGVFLAVPLYIYTLTDMWERRGSTELVEGKVIGPEGDFFQIRVGDTEWTQVNTGNLSDESDFEFLGPDEWTWAVVYDSTGTDVDDVMSYRVENIKEDYRSATCKQTKTLLPDSLIVLGTVECTGRNILEGSYIFISRVLRDKSRVVEIVASTSQSDLNAYEDYALRVRSFANGLELVQ